MEIYVDGKAIPAKSGQNVLETMYNAGIDLPHFCWHPALSVSGNCRMCLVEIGYEAKNEDGSTSIKYQPKLQIACGTTVAEGMHVNASSEKVLKARKAVMEFILINHPLDCPICDEAGECKLQDYALNHSIGESRYREEKQHKPKRTQWSDKIMYDAERCIMCSRCIRFAKEIAHDNVLTFRNRGDAVYIEVETDKTFNNPYSMNVIDICPVGALTSADFRFRSRVWDMSFGVAISPLDSTGSNICLGIKQNKILRATPVVNEQVNGHWITDETRLGVLKYNENRVENSAIRKEGTLQKATTEQIIAEVAAKLKSKYKPNEILFICSPLASNESNKALIDFAKNVIKTDNITYYEHIDESVVEDDRLVVKDKAPNTAGLKALLPNPKKMKHLPSNIKAVYVLEEDFAFNKEILAELKKVECLIAHCVFQNKVFEMADVVIASSSIFESMGSITNKDGFTQEFKPLIKTKEGLAVTLKQGRLDKFGASNDRWNRIDLRNTLQSRTFIKLMTGTLAKK